MADAMVTARMSSSKKEAGNRVLECLGCNASQVVNELYDYLIKNRALPWQKEERKRPAITKEQWAEAQAWLDSMRIDVDPRFATMTDDEIRHERLVSRGLLGA